MPHIAFLTLFLALVSGPQTVRLEVDQVQSVRIEVGGRVVAAMKEAPWTVVVDFGDELTPRKLEAVGYDRQGKEVARTSQVLNLPRQPAEVEIVIKNDEGRPVSAQLVGRNLTHVLPKRGRLSIDGKTLKLARDFVARLPSLDWSYPHVLSAEMRFADGQVATRELVMEGGVGDSASSELTPVLVRDTGSSDPATLSGCFAMNGHDLRANALENPNALVIMVKDPDTHEISEKLRSFHPAIDRISWPLSRERHELPLGANTTERIVWPIVQFFSAAGEPTNALFEHSNDIDSGEGGIYWLLLQALPSANDVMQPELFADAVAVAGVASISRPRRRAVVVVLSKAADRSHYAPAVVRRYLEQIGVPLFVWSASGPRPELAESWGAVDDISTEEGLTRATARVNAAIVRQRIAWVATDPLSALNVEIKDRCGLELVAHHHQPVVATGP